MKRLLYCLIIFTFGVNAIPKAGWYLGKVGWHLDPEQHGIDLDTLKLAEHYQYIQTLVTDGRVEVADEANDNVSVLITAEVREAVLRDYDKEWPSEFMEDSKIAMIDSSPFAFMQVFLTIDKSENTVLVDDLITENVKGSFIFDLLRRAFLEIAITYATKTASVEKVIVDDAIIQKNDEEISTLMDDFKKYLLYHANLMRAYKERGLIKD